MTSYYRELVKDKLKSKGIKESKGQVIHEELKND